MRSADRRAGIEPCAAAASGFDPDRRGRHRAGLTGVEAGCGTAGSGGSVGSVGPPAVPPRGGGGEIMGTGGSSTGGAATRGSSTGDAGPPDRLRQDERRANVASAVVSNGAPRDVWYRHNDPHKAVPNMAISASPTKRLRSFPEILIAGESVRTLRATLHATDAFAVTRTPSAHFRSSAFSATRDIQRAHRASTDVRQLN